MKKKRGLVFVFLMRTQRCGGGGVLNGVEGSLNEKDKEEEGREKKLY